MVMNVLSSSKSLKSKYQMVFAKTLNETEFCFVEHIWKMYKHRKIYINIHMKR